ncbi:MAG TPA: hypothetical protein VMG55_22745 [Stellaceae bacterium]|nr:hypothetical protein [Stellaceae bacterium]
MSWKRVRIELARSHDFPEGSHRHGYEMVLPLAPDDRVDEKALGAAPEVATVHRFWEGEGDAVGRIERVDGEWWISYSAGEAEDEPLHRFAAHRFREGEYLTVRAPVGGEHAFKVVAVRPAPGLAQGPG